MSQDHPLFHEIFAAARAGDTQRVLELVDQDRALLDITDSNVMSPILVAFKEGNLELAEQLIDRGRTFSSWTTRIIGRWG